MIRTTSSGIVLSKSKPSEPRVHKATLKRRELGLKQAIKEAQTMYEQGYTTEYIYEELASMMNNKDARELKCTLKEWRIEE